MDENNDSSGSRTTSPIITIDGSKGEGGGQVLRNAISYATILKKTVEVTNIRAGRSKPGLAPQHQTGLRLSATICGGTLEGDELRSQHIVYKPPIIESEDYNKNEEKTFVGDTKTAGSICLLLQAALPCALFGYKRRTSLILKGGTNADLAPQYDYWEHVFYPTVKERCNLPDMSAAIIRRGYYPRGGGEVHLHIPSLSSSQVTLLPIQPIVMKERGIVCDLYIRSFHAGKVPKHVAYDMVKSVQTILNKHRSHDLLPISVHPRIDIVTEQNAFGSGSGILLVAKTTSGLYFGASSLGSPKKKAKVVGEEAANELITTLAGGGCVDEWLQDQLILYMALANGTSEIITGSLTLHTQTAISIAEQVLREDGIKFTVEKLDDDNSSNKGNQSVNIKEANDDSSNNHYGKNGFISGRHLIRCEGIGLC